jgi:prevent-host-death family protein
MCYKMRRLIRPSERNDVAVIIRGVEAGEEYTVSRRGVPVARLVPITQGSDLRCDRPAKRRPEYAAWPLVQAEQTSARVLDDLRGHR